MILGSAKLRCKFFLEPAPGKEYLQWPELVDLCRYGQYPVRLQPTLIHQPTERSVPIVQLHPVLLKHPTFGSMWMLSIHRDELVSVPPPTLLSQPPTMTVNLGHRLLPGITLHCPSGVTFGGVIEALDFMRTFDDTRYTTDPDRYRRNHGEYILAYPGYFTHCSISTSETVADESSVVERARKSLESQQRITS